MHGIEANVEFDFGAADTLASACDTAATAVDGQSGSRSSYVTAALVDFKGHFSELFRTNAATAAGDALELSSRLREVATAVRRLVEEARKEQQRRETARAWKKEQDDRSLWDRGVDAVFGGDDPPVRPPAEPISVAVSPPVNRARQTPAPAAAGGIGGGGTSSARPANLRTFATGSKGANGELRPTPGLLRADYATFQAGCRWGTLDASGVFAGFDQWLSANDEDVRWATVVANAFKAAGGEGQVSTLSNAALGAALKAAGVDASRQDIVIEPPQAQGFPPTTGYADDPVNTATGNFVEAETDLTFPGAASMLALARCYNSVNRQAGVFGPGWSSLVEAGIVFDATAGTARFTLPDGRLMVFARLGSGWDRAVGENAWLAAEKAGGLRVSGNDGSWWRFAGDGTLLAYGVGAAADRNVVSLVRDEAGRPVTLEFARGRSIELVWGVAAGQGRVVGATSSDGRRIAYGYDDAGRLITAAGPLGIRSYRWTEAGGQSLMAAVVDADGVVEVDNTYDDQGRVVAQRSPFGRVSRYTYLPGRVTVVSDLDGTRSNTWIADERGRLVGVVDAHDQRQSTSYDRYGNPVLVTERDGAATVHEYDGRGRRIRTVTPSGADVTFGYDALDRTTTVVTEQGAVTEYHYRGTDRNPSRVTDPEGGVTELSWRQGLLESVTDPVGVVVRFGYDRVGDLVAVTDADGGTARVERDDLGRVTAAVTPSGHCTTYTYDPDSGQLAARLDPDGATWRYEYSTASRLIAKVDPLGARTSIEYGQDGEEARSVDPLGRAVTRHLDDLGNLAAVELPDGTSWRFLHDALSRLTATTDPTGGQWSREYDVTGRLLATVDPTGVRRGVAADVAAGRVQVDDGDARTTSSFDPLGRMTALDQPDGSSAMLVYDRCGRPVESLDAEGGLTLIRRDAAGRPVEVTSPTGAVTAYAYDRCGRLRDIVDPVGGRTTVAYDVDGHPVRQTKPTGEVAQTEYDSCGRVVAHRTPGVGRSSYVYDHAGRVVQTQDPRLGRRTFRYDDAGQLVAATDGNGSITRYEYDTRGRAVRITHPTGGLTQREFDGANRCVAETDPLGRTTRAGYDAAGRLAWQTDSDGHTTSWTYDAAGRPASMAVDGRTVTSLARDLRRRTVTIEDRIGQRPCVHELEWDRRGQLVRRARDGRAVSWSYDADGRRTTMTTPNGSTTRYGWDAAGRLAWVDSALLGRAAFDRDAAGRVVSATAGGLLQSWEHRNGFVVAHSSTDGEGATRTVLERDEDGRIVRIRRAERGPSTRAEATTEYSYDGARQLIEARSRDGGRETTSRWRYDAAGRMVAETVDGAVSEHLYDLAGQLLSSVGAEGSRTSYRYDGLGRRVRAEDSGGRTREYAWSPTGHLASVTEHDRDQVRRTTLHVDAVGELASVDGTEMFWDTAGYAGAPVLVGDTAVVAAGAVTGIGSDWAAPGWRTARATGSDPWSAGGGAAVDGVRIGAAGELSVGGLEWLGARVYDPAARGFLSVDPLDPATGAGWAGNPYAYGGNDPLHALDPLGLAPVTDAQLQAYRDANGGIAGKVGNWVSKAASATGHWFANNWEYVAGGAMVIAGGVLIATGVGGPAGMMLVSAGADTIIQKATTGHVNWGEVAVSGALGGIGGAGIAAKAGLTGIKATMVAGAASGGISGAGTSAYTYATGPGPHSVGGFLTATGEGAALGAATGGAGAAAGHGLAAVAGRTLSHVPSTPLRGVSTIARSGAGDGYAARVISGGRADGQVVFAGHGELRFGSGDVVVPDGTTVHMYSGAGDTISDSTGWAIESGQTIQPQHSFQAGETIPNYTLKAPNRLTIYSGSRTVEDATPLSRLLEPGMGDVHWAACTELRY